MAEACSFRNTHSESKHITNRDESFCIFNVFCVFISLVTILADLTTDLIVFAEYCKNKNIYWAVQTLVFIITPNILINIFSLRWIILDKKSKLHHWITHICLVGLMERYMVFLYEAFACKNLELIKSRKLFSQRNDLSLLHFLYTFTGTLPQIVLQSYAIVILDENYHTKAFALTASIASFVWSCATYIYSITSFDNGNFQWYSVIFKLIWHFGMLVARIASILLFTIVFGIWTLIPLGLHWAAMTFWIVTQKTTFCPNKLEETFYNVVMGFVYCFCYINLREGHTRYRLMMYYTLMITQNFGSLLLYILLSDLERQKKVWSILATIFVVAGTILGLCGMIFYYRWFHEKGPIVWKNVSEDIELNNKNMAMKKKSNNSLVHVRSFKSQKDPSSANSAKNGVVTSDNIPQSDIESADKKFLLEHWIARSGTPTFVTAPITNNSLEVSSIELHTVENTPQTIKISPEDKIPHYLNKVNTKQKKKIICPNELTLKISSLEKLQSSLNDITTSPLNVHKRRGICSSDELRDNLNNLDLDACNADSYIKSHKNDLASEASQDTDGSNKKTSSDSIDMDLDLSFSDINSSDINTFNENIVQKLCLSALKNIKVGNQDADIENIQRIALDILKEMYAKKGKNTNVVSSELFPKNREVDTPTELLSVHDYENICAVNIAREAWGLRSWNGYSDIENWLHDGSVVRDRRRDTLTSGSSEISSCISHELKNSILSAPPFPKKIHTYSNVFVRFDRNSQPDYVNTMACSSGSEDTFLAKPCVVDIKDPNHLEPIIEELDDLGDIDPPSKKRLNSESSLVATIDEIRKATVTNSPRNVYHRRDHLWDSPQFNSSKIESNLKKALWKEPSKFNSNNIMESFPEKEIISDVNCRVKLGVHKKELNIPNLLPSVESDGLENVAYRGTNRGQKSNNLQLQDKNFNSDEEPQDLSNKNIDYLWKLVSENNVSTNSAEDISSTHLTSSLQSLISKDLQSTSFTNSTKNSNAKRGTRSKPRRKFSILREKFEPRMGRCADEEILYQYASNIHNVSHGTISKLKNMELNPNMYHSETQNKQIQLNADGLAKPTIDSITSKDIKEKRIIFMKQVLSPPKFNTKLKYKS